VIQGIDGGKDYGADEKEEKPNTPPAKPNQNPAPPPSLAKDEAELLHAAINNAHDFLSQGDAATPTPFVCIKVPDVPNFVTDHIDTNEQAQLAAEFIDWLITGNRDGSLLRRRALSVDTERDYRKTKRDLHQTREKRKRHHNKTPRDQDDKKAMSIWERED